MTPRQRNALIGFGGLVAVYVGIRALSGDNDFDGFHRAARHVLETGTLSRVKDVARYPPSFQLLMLPFGLAPLWVAAAVWLLLSVLALWRLPALLERMAGVPRRAQLVACAVMLPLAVDNLNLGQSAPVLIALGALAVAWMREGRGVLAGLLVGLLALFKVLPVVLLAIPFLVGRRATGLAALGGFVLAVALAAGGLVAVVGWEETADATTTWVTKTRAEQTPWALVANNRSLRHNNEGLGVVLARTFGDIAPARADGSVSLATWPLRVPWTAYGVMLALAFAAGLRGALAARRLVASDPDHAWGGLFALAGIGMLLVSPIVWTHYWLWLLPALALLHERRRLVLWGGLAFVATFAARPLCGLGVHAWAGWALFLYLAWELATRARATKAGPRRARVGDDRPAG